MVLHHVAQRARAFVISRAALHAERFRGGDLDVIDVAAIPDRLEDRVCEPEHENVLRGLFPEEVIDPVSLILGERAVHDAIELAR